jgi:xanthine dehydrogenase accessory factor
MIGSRRKNRMIFEKLLEEGISQSQLDQVHAPIGLKIQAETPAEIAVSIVAELIQTRAQGHAEKIKDWHV